MAIELVSCRNPRYLADEKVVDAFIRFTGGYVEGGVTLRPRDFGLSELTDVDDTIAEGYVLRWGGDTVPYRLQLFGKDPTTLDQMELHSGFDLSALDNVRVRLYGW